jgi:hypothetical protein
MMPWVFPALHLTRPNSLCINCALGQPEGFHLFLNAGDRSGLLKHFDPASVIELERYYQNDRPPFSVGWIETRNVMSVIKQAKLKHIDYFSLDVEGAEIPILESIDFSEIPIRVFAVEDNHGTWLESERVLAPHGYEFLGSMQTDGFFIHRDLARELGAGLENARSELTPRR